MQFMGEWELKGYERGIQQGRQDDILRVLASRFGPVPEAVEARVRGTHDPDELVALLERAAVAERLEDFRSAAG